MRSIRSLLLFGVIVLSFHGAAESRGSNDDDDDDDDAGAPKDAAAAVVVPVPANPPATTVGSTKRVPPRRGSRQVDTETLEREAMRGMRRRLLLRGADGDRFPGGGSSPASPRALARKRDWARDDDGKLLWWIWLIIGLCIALCLLCAPIIPWFCAALCMCCCGGANAAGKRNQRLNEESLRRTGLPYQQASNNGIAIPASQ